MIIQDAIIDRALYPLLHAYVTINTATDRFQWGSARHPLQIVSRNSATSIPAFLSFLFKYILIHA